MSSFTNLEMAYGSDEFTGEALYGHKTVTAPPASHRVPGLEAPEEPCEAMWAALDELHWAASC